MDDNTASHDEQMRSVLARLLEAGAEGDEQPFHACLAEAQSYGDRQDELAEWLLCACHYGLYYFHAQSYREAEAENVAARLIRQMPLPVRISVEEMNRILRAVFYDHLPDRHPHTRPLHHHLYAEYGDLLLLPYSEINELIAATAAAIVASLRSPSKSSHAWANRLAEEAVVLMDIERDWDNERRLRIPHFDHHDTETSPPDAD